MSKSSLSDEVEVLRCFAIAIPAGAMINDQSTPYINLVRYMNVVETAMK